MNKQLYVPFEQKDIEKGVELCGSKVKLAKYLTEHNSSGLVVSKQMLWNWFNRTKTMHSSVKKSLEALLKNNT